ncbi:two-component system, sensor histidine kinase YesM [Cohnella sp. OV330]|uniref:sensor histidine kinase n=1 Tax=Cohnella sp. OV330 TaxID=1855288 RepID=UPI0008E53DCB|nr:histidine kinase [Cohnella sp. OV330]SFB14265.1 two-component system, sensor histidine kinase YesM [Cohnella sp. OV330]
MASSKWARFAQKEYGRLYNISIKKRVRLAFMVMIALAICAVGVSSYKIAARELQKNAFATRQEAVNKTAQILDDKLYQISNAVRSIMFSDAYKQMMTDVQSNRIADYYVHLSELQYVFSQVGYNEPLIDGILIATPIGDFYPISRRRSQTQSFYESNLYYDIKNLTGGKWIEGHTDKFFTGNSRALSFVTKGMAGDDSDTNVFIVVNVNESGLIATLNRQAASGGDPYFIADGDGEEVVRTDWSAAHGLHRDEPFLRRATGGQGSFFYDFDKAEYLVNYTRSSVEPDWLLYGVQEKSKLLAQMKGVQRTTLVLMGVFLLLSWLLSNRLTGLLLLPLFKLQRLMREVEDNRLDVRFSSRSGDEVAQVGFQFNRMLDEINRLIRDARDSEAGKRKAEMRALTAQMEPHFLYNTLNTIYCKSVLGENDDVNEMIMALSQMFQLGLSGGKDWNTLEDELSHVRQYCAIQQKCYEGLFDYEASVSDDALLGCTLPKILLQPIVENSIQHGFKDRSVDGRIRIKADRENGLLHLTIEDNGSGFDAEQVKQRMQLNRDAKKGYALVNIRERLRLFYGDDARMALSNTGEGGARTDLWIPIGRTEGEGDA